MASISSGPCQVKYQALLLSLSYQRIKVNTLGTKWFVQVSGIRNNKRPWRPYSSFAFWSSSRKSWDGNDICLIETDCLPTVRRSWLDAPLVMFQPLVRIYFSHCIMLEHQDQLLYILYQLEFWRILYLSLNSHWAWMQTTAINGHPSIAGKSQRVTYIHWLIRRCAIILGTFFGYSRIFGYHFLVQFDFFRNNPDFWVLIFIFYFKWHFGMLPAGLLLSYFLQI